MCGIAGVFFQGAKGSETGTDMSGVLDRLARRGPDGQGISRGPGWVFGHRRLAVIDLRGGAQPLEDSHGALTYNGELYNYRELRDLLREDGQSFTTASDTEVVLKAWRAWGPACLKRFNGMFAFAIYDRTRDSIFLARDHLGIKPLFYYAGKEGFYFASTMAALLAFEGVPAVADPVGISHYLTTTHVVMGSRTLVKGASSLEPGSWIEVRRDFSENPPRQVRYWQLPAQRREAISFQQAAAQTRELVHDSVRSQLISDVPLGGFLSGGIDSTILASQASKLCAFNAYSVGYQYCSSAGESYNEWPYIREAAASYGIGCKEIVLEQSDYPTDWKFLIAEKGQPLSTPNEIGIYRLAGALRQEYTVALSGEGADEVFGGYTEACFSVIDFVRSRQLDRFDPSQREALSSALKRMYGTDQFNSLLDHFLRLIAHMNFGVKFNLLQPKWQEELKSDELLIRHYADRFATMKNCTPFDAYMRLILEKNLQTLLFRLDSSTMAASVEGRVPFTDPRLVALLFSLPDHYKMDWSEEAGEAETLKLNTIEAAARGLIRSKMLLRAAFADVVPQSILTRRKMSFPTPFLEWFAGSMRAMVEESLRESPWARGWLRPESVEFLLANLDKPAYGQMAWPLVNLCLWQESMGISWD
ncbi:MAG: asparagine synthase (glutamine-hydrolyzing) [Syntrophobacteraceae bacterium]